MEDKWPSGLIMLWGDWPRGVLHRRGVGRLIILCHEVNSRLAAAVSLCTGWVLKVEGEGVCGLWDDPQTDSV